MTNLHGRCRIKSTGLGDGRRADRNRVIVRVTDTWVREGDRIEEPAIGRREDITISVDRDGYIGELQPFDIPDPVGAVVAADEIGLPDGNEPFRVRTEIGNRVVGEVASIDCRVDIGSVDVAAQHSRDMVSSGVNRGEVRCALSRCELDGISVRIIVDLPEDL